MKKRYLVTAAYSNKIGTPSQTIYTTYVDIVHKSVDDKPKTEGETALQILKQLEFKNPLCEISLINFWFVTNILIID